MTMWAAENPVVGTWDVTATPDQGEKTVWTLVVKEADGKLSGTLSNAEGAELPLVNPKLDGKQFQFTLMINGQPYTVENKIDGKKIEGKFKGPDAAGSLVATKRG